MMRKMEKCTKNRVANYKYPGPVAKAAARVFFLPETDHELFKSYVQVQGGIGQGKGIHFV